MHGKRNYAILALLIGCGLRRGELLALRVEQDIVRMLIHCEFAEARWNY